MIQALSKHITQYMFSHDEYIDSFAIHQYGIEVIISTFINTVLILGIGIYFNKGIDAFIYMLGFYAIRKFCGGYHCHTYARCIGLHTSLFGLYLLTYTWYENVSLYITIGSIIIFVLCVPIRNRSLTKGQYKLYKQISVCILLGYIVLANITCYTSIFTYIIMTVSILVVVCIGDNEKNDT